MCMIYLLLCMFCVLTETKKQDDYDDDDQWWLMMMMINDWWWWMMINDDGWWSMMIDDDDDQWWLIVMMMILCRFHALIEASKQDLIALGFPQFTIEDFHDVVSVDCQRCSTTKHSACLSAVRSCCTCVTSSVDDWVRINRWAERLQTWHGRRN